jgi:arabinose-5-phosphate isomerase
MNLPHAKITPTPFDANSAKRALDFALETLQIEADAILTIKQRLANEQDSSFSRAIALLLQCDSRFHRHARVVRAPSRSGAWRPRHGD